jgi:hypothetical protein
MSSPFSSAASRTGAIAGPARALRGLLLLLRLART